MLSNGGSERQAAACADLSEKRSVPPDARRAIAFVKQARRAARTQVLLVAKD